MTETFKNHFQFPTILLTRKSGDARARNNLNTLCSLTHSLSRHFLVCCNFFIYLFRSMINMWEWGNRKVLCEIISLLKKNYIERMWEKFVIQQLKRDAQQLKCYALTCYFACPWMSPLTHHHSLSLGSLADVCIHTGMFMSLTLALSNWMETQNKK